MDRVLVSFLGVDWTIGILMIPIFAGIIGYGTNWLAVNMMFKPIKFWGIKLPFTVAGLPVIGWQGIVPNRSWKLASIAVDTGLAKMGKLSEMIQDLNPEVLIGEIIDKMGGTLHQIVDDVLESEYPELWNSLPAAAKDAVHKRIEAEMAPALLRAFNEVGENMDRLVNVKLMVIEHLAADPKVLVAIMKDAGEKEIKFVINAGFYFGTLLGLGPMLIYAYLTQHWVAVPIGAAVVGYLTNVIALNMIFEPAEPTKKFGITLHGLMMRRRAEIAENYSQLIAHQVLTIPVIVDTMFNGPNGDRTKQFLADLLRPMIEEQAGVARYALQATGGRYEGLQEGLVNRGLSSTTAMMADKEFIVEQQNKLRLVMQARLARMEYPDLQTMMRTPFKQDEWLLFLVGAILGFGAGLAQVAITL